MTRVEAGDEPFLDPADEFASRIRGNQGTHDFVEELLEVDDRVLARVTDGIYRRPASALRELIFNAYDADATRVVIETDAPRFTRMSVRDNGNGMNERLIADLVKHIGGSSKRTNRGGEIGTTRRDNPDFSPMGRPLIGKIGIGLFAVSHLTPTFRIITKRKGMSQRLVATIELMTHSEQALRSSRSEGGKPEKFTTGRVRVRYEPADDPETQGTEIILLNVRKPIRELLRKADIWDVILERKDSGEKEHNRAIGEIAVPVYHIGYAGRDSAKEYIIEPNLPWEPSATPEKKFAQLFEKVVETGGARRKNPDIDEFLDAYLGMLWRLSLSPPLPYLGTDPFQFKAEDGIEFYRIQNQQRGQAEILELAPGQTVAEAAGLEVEIDDPCGGFSVMIDGVELCRPVSLPSQIIPTSRSVRAKRPMLFVGGMESKALAKQPPEQGGGPLRFTAYFYWNSVVVPKQNRGVLIRIHNASGTLYDDSFLEYQVSEINRLNQITGEIFIHEGLEWALNIDRESFNLSHPHYQYLTRWVHSALRQITNRLKELGKKALQESRQEQRIQALTDLQAAVLRVWEERADDLESIPSIKVVEKEKQLSLETGKDGASIIVELDKDVLAEALADKRNDGPTVRDRAVALLQILAAHGLLDDLPSETLDVLFRDIVQVLVAGR